MKNQSVHSIGKSPISRQFQKCGIFRPFAKLWFSGKCFGTDNGFSGSPGCRRNQLIDFPFRECPKLSHRQIGQCCSLWSTEGATVGFKLKFQLCLVQQVSRNLPSFFKIKLVDYILIIPYETFGCVLAFYYSFYIALPSMNDQRTESCYPRNRIISFSLHKFFPKSFAPILLSGFIAIYQYMFKRFT